MRGISRFKYQLWLFGLSAFFTGLAGAVYATNFRAIVPDVFSLTLLPRGLVGALATLRHRPPQRGIPVSAR